MRTWITHVWATTAPSLDNECISLTGGLHGIGSHWNYQIQPPAAAPPRAVSLQKHVTRGDDPKNLIGPHRMFKKKPTIRPPPAVLFYFNYTCRVKKKSTKNNETMTISIIYTFTVQLYNISTRLNTLETIYTVGFTSPCCTVFKQKYMTNLVYLHTLSSDWNAKGLNFDCNSKTELILQCTRQLNSVCRVCLRYRCVE